MIGVFESRKDKIKRNVLDFLFPIRFHRSTSAKIRLLIIIGMMIAFRLILALFSVKILPTFRISISKVPIAILGWHIGVVMSLLVGFITNNLAWLMSGTVWYWLYAIQEPLEMMLNALIGFIYNARCKGKKNFGDFIFLQIVIVTFWFLTIFFMLYSSKDIISIFAFGFKTVTIFSLVVFLLTLELILFISFFKKKFDNAVLFIYVVMVSTLSSFIFSFILGTFSAIKYFEYVNGTFSNKYKEYGYLVYLLPRIVKETFRLPLIIAVTFIIQDSICVPCFIQFKHNARNYW